jgi:hypothetical protein
MVNGMPGGQRKEVKVKASKECLLDKGNSNFGSVRHSISRSRSEVEESRNINNEQRLKMPIWFPKEA